jgi:hypothetical protein
MPIGISRARAYRVLSICLFPLVLLVVSCQSRKDLNEDLAKTLLQEAFKNSTTGDVYHGHRVDTPPISLSGNKVFPVNFSDPEWQSTASPESLKVKGDPFLMARLIQTGYIAESVQEVTYVLPGHLSGQVGTQLAPGDLTSIDNFDATLALSGRDVSGTWTTRPTRIMDMKGACTGGHVDGWLLSDGRIQLMLDGGGYVMGGAFFPCYRTVPRYEMRPMINNGKLQFNGSSTFLQHPMNLTGDRPQTVKLMWYRYDWTAKALVPNGSENACDVGTIQVRTISSLVLQGTETQATATFVYRVVHNDFGTIVEGGHIADGLGFARFTKKPDGTWILSSFQLTNHV